jgi:DNA-binding MarR family transcriptional regulator
MPECAPSSSNVTDPRPDRFIEAGAMLRRLMLDFENDDDFVIGTTGVSFCHLLALRSLCSPGPMSVGDVGRRLCANSSSTTRVIDHLERNGLVQRQRHATDRRMITLSITPAGRRIAALAEPLARDAWARRFAPLDEDRFETLFEILSSMNIDRDPV